MGDAGRGSLQVIAPITCKVGRRWPRVSNGEPQGDTPVAPRLEMVFLCSVAALWFWVVGEMPRMEGKEVTAGISERCHFSFVFCQGLLTSACWVTGVNPSRGERWVSSAEVEAAPIR